MSGAGKLLANVSVVAIRGRALMVAGPPGSGKSSLALALIDRGAVLVGDDGVSLCAKDGEVWVAPPPNTAGLMEVREVGLATFPLSPGVPLALVLDLGIDALRMPETPDQRVIAGRPIPLLGFSARDAVAPLRAEYALEMHGLRFPSDAPHATQAPR